MNNNNSKSLYDKYLSKLLNKETILYLVFGVLTTVVDFLVYIIATNLSVNYLVANVISWVFAVAFAFITNKHFVFESKKYDKDTLKNEMIDFVSARIFSLAFNLLFIYIVVTCFNANKLLTKVIAAVFVVIINYILSKFYIFSDKSLEEDSENVKSGVMIRFISNNLGHIIAFVTPLIILFIIYKNRGIYPFGDNMYLRSDCYHQYAPFMKEFYNKLSSGKSLQYSWNIGLGVNFSSLYSYYLASPINWLIAFTPAKNITETMNVLIVLKTALCSLTFSIYAAKHFKTKNISTAAMGIFYALSAYFCAYSWNLMWLDCLILLPIITLGLERLVKEGKGKLYCIALGIAIFSNYYIGIMLCIYCVLYFFVLLYSTSSSKKQPSLNPFKKLYLFAIYSLLAGGIAAITFIPAYLALSGTASNDFAFPKEMMTYFSVAFMLSRSLINVEPSIFTAHDPNLYCGVIVFLLVPMYAINPKINFKEKIAKIALVAFMLFSFNTNIPNYIWHGFHYPNSLPARESFIYIFLLLSMSYESFIKIGELTRKQIFAVFAGAIAVILFIEENYVSDTYSSMSIYLSIMFLIIYMVVFSLYRSNNFKRNFIAFLLIIIMASEAYVNANNTALSTCTRSAYVNDNEAITTLVTAAKSDAYLSNSSSATDMAADTDFSKFCRIEKENRRSKNDAAWSNYYGASTFSSTALAGLSELYGSLGMEESTNAYAYYGHTTLTESLFSIRYVMDTKYEDASEYRTLIDSTTYKDTYKNENTYYLYKNNYCLPLAFMMPAGINENWDNSSSNPFSNLNNLADTILERTGSDSDTPMYTRLDVTTLGEDNQVYLNEAADVCIYVTTSLDSINVNIQKNEGTAHINSDKVYNSMTQQHIIDLGNLDAGTTVTVSSNDSETPDIQIYAYAYDEEIFKEVYNKLSTSSSFEITSFKETDVKGTITANESGMLYTSIPDNGGWTVYVDGKKVKTYSFKNALLALDLDAGKHTIEFKYSSPGLKLGAVLTVVSIIVLILLQVWAVQLNKRKKSTVATEKNEETDTLQ